MRLHPLPASTQISPHAPPTLECLSKPEEGLADTMRDYLSPLTFPEFVDRGARRLRANIQKYAD